jgi:predicted metal-dependent phosphoesterase TrpH
MSASRRVKVDMHMHSDVSPDSRMTPRVMAERIRAVGLDVACVTDHNSIRGALRLREIADGSRVIVGSEVLSRDGEIVGLFLEQDVPPRLSADETIERIHAQGGIVSIPHPFSRNRRNHITAEALERVVGKTDAVEVFNAREALASDNERAAAFVARHAVAGSVGSDAHRPSEIGAAWIEMDDFGGRDDFVAALRTGTVHGRLSGLFVHVGTRWDVLRKRIAASRDRA